MDKVYININELGKAIRTTKLSYKGEIDDHPVYKVPISQLYFNDENGRIATFMSQYENEHPGQDIKQLPNEEYNDIIADFIEKANSADTFKKTLNDIRLKGQLVAGVILDDGRVIDGNRRFTCLRKLYNETSNNKFFYFECVVLPTPKNENDRKELRTLELNLQFDVDEKQTYSAIDRLVSIYNDLLGPKKIYKIDEYGKKFNMEKSDLKYLIVKTQIMIDYLDFINKPLMFYIARDYKLDPGLHELVPLRKKIDDAEWDRIKVAFYYWFDKKVDLRVKVRQTVSLHKNNKTKFEEWLDERLEAEEEKRIAEFKEKFNSNGKNKSNQDSIEKVKEIKSSDDKVKEEFDNTIYDMRVQNVRSKPLELVNYAYKKLEKIDLDIVECLNNEELNELNESLEKLKTIIEKIKGSMK